MFWDKIDHLFYINLDHRKDRNEHCLNELSKIGAPSEKIERFNAVKHKKGVIGCSLSHIECLKLAIERNYDNVLIVEDDILFRDKEYFFKICDKIFDQKFDVFMLGVNIQKYEPLNDLFIRVKYGLSLVGYIIQKHYFQTLLDIFQQSNKFLIETNRIDYAIDTYIKVLQEKDIWLSFNKLNVGQLASYSDIEYKNVNYEYEMYTKK
jgi:GR25 family glycosyltransferase involved in LPS biosynthesis